MKLQRGHLFSNEEILQDFLVTLRLFVQSSELLKDLEEMFPSYFMHGDISSSVLNLQTRDGVLSVAKSVNS